MRQAMKIAKYVPGDAEIWIPVSKATSTSSARAFLPHDGLAGTYQYGYKAEPQRGNYLTALAAIQSAYIHDESDVFRLASGKEQRQYKAKWRHGKGASPPNLGPAGWVNIPFSDLATINEDSLLAALASSGAKFAGSGAMPDPEGEMFVPLQVQARTFQRRFRANALKIWPAVCALSGATLALEAAHIKPVSKSRHATEDLLSSYNSLILNAALHCLFDQGLFSFSADGELIVSPSLGTINRRAYGLDRVAIVDFRPEAAKYIEFHREHVFVRDAQPGAAAGRLRRPLS